MEQHNDKNVERESIWAQGMALDLWLGVFGEEEGARIRVIGELKAAIGEQKNDCT